MRKFVTVRRGTRTRIFDPEIHIKSKGDKQFIVADFSALMADIQTKQSVCFYNSPGPPYVKRAARNEYIILLIDHWYD